MNIGWCYFNRIVEENEKIWFASLGIIYCLFQLDKSNGKIECLGGIPINYKEKESYSAIGKIGNRIIIAPYYCNGAFIEYNLHDKMFKKIPLEYDICSDYGTFTYVIKYKTSLYFIGSSNGVIVEAQDNGSYKYHFKWAFEIADQIKNKLFFSGCQYIGNSLYLPIFGTNKVVMLEMPNCKLKQVITFPFEYKILSQFYDGTDIWYIPVDGNMIAIWRKKSNIFETIKIPLCSTDKRPLKALVFYKDVLAIRTTDENDFLIQSDGQIYEYKHEVASTLKNSEIIQSCIYTDKSDCEESIYFLHNDIFMEVSKKGIKKYTMDIDYDDLSKSINFDEQDWHVVIKYEKNRKSLYNFIGLCKKRSNLIKESNQSGRYIYNQLLRYHNFDKNR